MSATKTTAGFFGNEQSEFPRFVWQLLGKKRPAVIVKPAVAVEPAVAEVQKRDKTSPKQDRVSYECDNWLHWTF
ncbi:MAG: hypothetical protein JWP38_2082 [Herbaspirillum sp.]|nr:hypothetical protein [Herbaspirillum sp.]